MDTDVKLEGLNASELDDILRWARDQRDKYIRLVAKLERQGRDRISEATNEPGQIATGSLNQNGDLTPKVVAVIKPREWLKNAEIRERLTRVGIFLNRNRLREIMSKGEGVYFKQKGNRGSSRWSLIDKG